jgi:hypothetical protein
MHVACELGVFSLPNRIFIPRDAWDKGDLELFSSAEENYPDSRIALIQGRCQMRLGPRVTLLGSEVKIGRPVV